MHRAALLFDSRGYDQARMQDIAADLGISKPTLYTYFSGKTDILMAIFDQVIAGADAILDDVERMPGGFEPLRAFVGGSLAFGCANRAMMNVFMSDERSLPDDLRRRHRRWSRKAYRRCLALVANAQRGMPTVDARTVTFAITAFINQVGVWFSQKGDLSLPEVAADFCTLLESGILRRDVDDAPVRAVAN